MTIKAFFLDKDGTIVDNSKYPDIVPRDQLLQREIIKGLKLIQKKGYKIFIISNQSTIAKKWLTRSEVEVDFQNIVKKLKEFDIEITEYIYCPHNTKDNCECKKPKTLLMRMLIKRHNIDIKSSYVVGDMDKDILMGKNIGAKTILVKTGRGNDFLDSGADYIIKNINEIEVILNDWKTH